MMSSIRQLPTFIYIFREFCFHGHHKREISGGWGISKPASDIYPGPAEVSPGGSLVWDSSPLV